MERAPWPLCLAWVGGWYRGVTPIAGDARYLLRICGQALFSGPEADANLAAIANGLARPLQPELGDSAAAFAGPTLLALLAAAPPAAIAPAIPALLIAVAGVPLLLLPVDGCLHCTPQSLNMHQSCAWALQPSWR